MSLRKRNSQPSMHINDHYTSLQSISKHRRNNGRKYGLIALYCAVFFSSPILLLLATRLPRAKNHKTLLPLSLATRNLHVESIKLAKEMKKPMPYFQQQDQPKQLRANHKLSETIHTPTTTTTTTLVVVNDIIRIQDHVVSQVRNNILSIAENIPTIPVVVWPYVDYGAGTAELQHFCENGIQESPYLTMSHNVFDTSSNIVWIADFGFAFSSNRWCDAFHEVIVKVQEHYGRQQQRNQHIKKWPIFIVDWSDQTNMPHCKQIEDNMGSEWVQYFIRNVVTGRQWNATREWVDVGQRVVLPPNYHHVPLFVRTDTVQTLENVLRDKYNMTLASPIERLERKVDVSHFWPLDLKGVREVNKAKLRQKVSQIISEMGNSTKLNMFVGLAGNALQAGRRNVKTDYIEAMLNSKIIVVTQRDDWNDHYRLFEALVSGAMVMTDRMLSLPQGLKNGTSIVEFESKDDLQEKILYYISHDDERIEIATKGREVAMRQHRTFHRVEQVVFGRELSDCSTSGAASSCPWIVHASEAITNS